LDDPAVYREIQQADTVGVFQIESRAQMQSLLRTRPENLDDLTVQVALVRPGPIQGGAVHPYIEHRQKLRENPGFVPPYDHPLLEEPLRETLGVVVFQEQVLGVAKALAGFSVGEAEGLRRAMSRKRSREAVEAFHERFVQGAIGRGVDRETAEAVFQKLNGFAAFGFPKSHAAAFGLLAYQSAWLRHHYPREFLCALLNAQPMGFYPPASLVRDAQRRGVKVRGPDVTRSAARCALEGEAVRIGLEYVRLLGEEEARAVVVVRERGGPFASVRDLAQRTELDRARLEALVASGVCDSFGGGRRKLLWELGFVPRNQTVPGSGGDEQQLALPLDPTAATPGLREQTPWERMLADYRTTSLSVGTHPLALLRKHLPEGTLSSRELGARKGGGQVAVAGMAVARQRPATANGVVFMLLEDEFGQVNLIVPPAVYGPPPSRWTVAGIGARVGRGFGPNACFLLHSAGPTVRDRRRRQNPGRATHRRRVCADPRLRAHRRRPHRGARREGRLGGLALPPERRLSLGLRADPGRRPRRVVPTGAIRAVQVQPALPAGLERARNDLRDGGRFGAPDRRDEPPARRPPLAAARALPQGRRPRRRRADALAPRAPLRLRPRRRAGPSP